MPLCCIVSCTNKETLNDITFHKFPKDSEILNKWLAVCGKNVKSPTSRYNVVCSRHFIESDFQRDLQSELLGLLPRKRILKPDAIPTVNLPSMSSLNEDSKHSVSQIIEESIAKSKNELFELNKTEVKWRTQVGILCRLCAKSDYACVSILLGKGSDLNLKSKILKYIHLEVDKDDKLPDQVCPLCLSAIISWHEYADVCNTAAGIKEENKEIDWQDITSANIKFTTEETGHTVMIKSEPNWGREIESSCCLCKKSDENLISINSEEVFKFHLQVNIKKYLETDVQDDDHVCYPCMNAVNSWHEFVERCLLTNEKLQELLHVEDDVEHVLKRINEIMRQKEADEYIAQETQNNAEGKKENITIKEEEIEEVAEGSENIKSAELSTLSKNCVKSNEETHGTSTVTNVKPKEIDINVYADMNNDVLDSQNVNTEFQLRNTNKVDQEIDQSDIHVNVTSETNDQDNIENNSEIKPELSDLPMNKCPKIMKLVKQDLIKGENYETFSESILKVVLTKLVSNIKPCDNDCVVNASSYLSSDEPKIFSETANDKNYMKSLVNNQYCVERLLLKDMKSHSDACSEVTQCQEKCLEQKKGHKRFKCEICGKILKAKISSYSHQRIHTSDKQYSCHVCSLAFIHKGDKDKHVFRIHEQNSSQACGKILKSNTNFHQKTHLPKGLPEDKQHMCKTCNRIFKSEKKLYLHQKTHLPNESQDKQHTCEICGKILKSNTNLQLHRKTHLPEELRKKFKCDICKVEYKHFDKLRKHVKCKHLNQEMLICDICKKSFRSLELLKTHLKVHSENHPHICPHCNKGFKWTKNLNKHVNVIHKGIKHKSCPVTCNLCGIVLNSKTALKRHFMSHDGVKLFKCSVCEKRFTTNNAKIYHERIHTGEKPFKCDKCDKSFRYNALLQAHYYIHTNIMPYRCKFCDRYFYHCKTLIMHERIHTGDRSIKHKSGPVACDLCGNLLNSKTALKRHFMSHDGIKLFKCSVCEKRFTTNNAKIYHERIHTGEKPFKCDKCDKSFRSNALLKAHYHIHTNTMPYHCKFCDKCFRRPGNLIMHERIHTGDKRYSCHVCSRAFIQKGDRDKHVLTHFK